MDKKPFDPKTYFKDLPPEVIDYNTPVNFYKSYAGIGDSKTPDHVQSEMRDIAIELNKKNYILRTSGVSIPDSCFEEHSDDTEIYLPWKDFNNSTSKIYKYPKECRTIAAIFNNRHWENLSFSVQAMLVRNVCIILGQDLKSPIHFLICWTPDGIENISEKTSRTGFISHPISIANAAKIPVFNLFNADARSRLNKIL